MSDTAPLIEVKVTPPVGTILLNRSQHGNALSQQMLTELATAVHDLHRDTRARAVILTGAGNVFAQGQDMQEMASDQAIDADNPAAQQSRWGEQADDIRQLLAELLEFPKPMIAAVNGPAVGLGVALAMTSDIAIATATAELSLPSAKQGLVAGFAAPLVAYRVGTATATRLAIIGQTIDATEAYRLGVFQELVPEHLLWARAMELGAQAARSAPQAVSLTKRLLMETVGEKLLTDLASGSIAVAASRTTPAAEHGLKAIAEGTDPSWD